MADESTKPADFGSERRRGLDRGPVAVKLASGSSVAETARECGVGETTIRGWLREAEFAAHVREIRAELLSITVGKLANASAAAVDTLAANLNAERPGDAIGAAKAIIDRHLKGAELLELDERVRALEGRLGDRT